MGMCGTVLDTTELNLTLCVSEHCWLRCEYLQWVYVYSDEDQKGRAGVGIKHLGCYLARCALPDSSTSAEAVEIAICGLDRQEIIFSAISLVYFVAPRVVYK